MGRLPTGEREYAIKRVWDVHREIMRLAVTGLKQVDIAEMLGVTEAMVSYTMNSPIAKRELENMRAARDLDAVDIAKRIQETLPRALDTLEELLDEGTDVVRLRAAQDLLDRGGHAAVRTVRTDSVSIHLTKDDIDEIKERARGLGLCIDVGANL